MKSILNYLIVLITFTNLLLAQNEQEKKPKFWIDKVEYDFGDVEEGKIVSTEFIIGNEGNDILRLNRIVASCGCTATQPEKNSLEPKEKVKLKVDFNTIGRLGPQKKSVYISTNDPMRPSVKLTFTANVLPNKSSASSVKPIVEVFEYSKNFGEINKKQIQKYSFLIRNSGNEVLEIQDVLTTCDCIKYDFPSRKLLPLESMSINISFNPSKLKGAVSHKIKLKTNDIQKPEIEFVIFANVK